MAFPLSSPSTPPLLPTAPAVDPVTGAFAQAINSMQPPRPLVSLSPALPRPSPSSSSTMPSTPNISVTSFSEVQPSALHNTLAADNTLILDIRPHNAYTLGRLPNALPMSVPSTLLKRPGFSLAKLCQMLPSVAARERFSDWQNADRILVYDADSSSLVEGGNLLGLLRKFRTEGYTRDVAFVKGGFHAVWREMPSLVDTQPPPREDDEDSLPAMTKSASAPSVAPALRTKQLPMSAFTLSSTAASSQPSLSLSQRRAMHHHSLSLSQSQSETHTIPPTPMFIRSDPFSTLAPLPSTSSSSLRLPPTREGVATTAFPQYPPSSLPTLSPQPGFLPRPHYNSLPPVPTMAFNPFFDNVRQNLELRGSDASINAAASGGIQLKLPRRVRRRVGDLPFEWLRRIARRSGKIKVTELSGLTESEEESNVPVRILRLSPDSPSSSNTSEEDLTRLLASQFYKIELGEQRRLMGVMERHSKESGAVMSSGILTTSGSSTHGIPVPRTSANNNGYLAASMRSASYSGPITGPISGAYSLGDSITGRSMPSHGVLRDKDKEGPGESEAAFPYSITAGIEKGTKNRYRNIWPFEHARVRLLRKSSNGEEDDYMNASYVQPLGTTKRYIATQGPLPATFNDFWTLCWEQNVHVIVMLTREVESASVKCGNYWNDGSYGALELKLVETNDTSERERKRRENELSSGFFNIPAQHGAKASKSRPNHKPDGASAEGEDEEATPHTIRRVFSLTHTGYPFVPPRTVIQLQYLEWPDMNVPDNCKGVLQLIRDVEMARASTMQAGDKVWGEGPLRYEDAKRTQALSRMPVPSVLPDSTEGARNDEDAPLGDSSRLDELDPKTGIARHAIGNPPVLLHCSAGVGRTGGFIAVDAVLDGIRREMRKRSESSRGQGTTSAGESYSGMDSGSEVMESSSPPRETSESRSSTNGDGTGEGEPMEVDSSNNSSPSPPRVQPSPDLLIPSQTEATPSTGLTMPMSVGRNEVHVPVAGFSVPMDVDSASAPVQEPSRPGMPRKSSVLASQELVSEVKRATMLNRMLSKQHAHAHPLTGPTGSSILDAPHMGIVSPVPQVPSKKGHRISATTASITSDDSASLSHNSSSRRSIATTGSASASASHFGSGTGSRTDSVEAGTASSTTSLLMMAKTAGLSLGDKDEEDKEGSPPQESKSRETVTADDVPSSSVAANTPAALAPKAALAKSPSAHTKSGTASSSRLDDWRSEVRNQANQSIQLPNAQESDGASSPEDENIAAAKIRAMAQPRRLHDNASPPMLSTYDSPVRRVVEDMRQQRMSLCQSLRQYVFVHRAIIEGALMIVDEEKERQARRGSESPDVQMNLDGEEGLGGVEIKTGSLADAGSARSGLASSNVGAENMHRAPPATAGSSSSSGSGSSMCSSHDPFDALGRTASVTSSSAGPSSTLGSAFVLRDGGMQSRTKNAVPIPLDLHHPMTDIDPSPLSSPPSAPPSSSVASSPTTTLSPGRSKRGPSPTELLKQGTSGEVLLTKRPSIKRRQRSEDAEGAMLQVKHVHSASVSSPPPHAQ